MKMELPFVNSHSFPQTAVILGKFLPQVFSHRCFNNKNLPFYQEACQTELGHLFEHILLEYLRQLKVEAGFKDPVYRGETSWNWNQEKEGIFHIEISAGEEDLEILRIALEKSISLMNIILSSSGTIPEQLYVKTAL